MILNRRFFFSHSYNLQLCAGVCKHACPEVKLMVDGKRKSSTDRARADTACHSSAMASGPDPSLSVMTALVLPSSDIADDVIFGLTNGFGSSIMIERA